MGCEGAAAPSHLPSQSRGSRAISAQQIAFCRTLLSLFLKFAPV